MSRTIFFVSEDGEPHGATMTFAPLGDSAVVITLGANIDEATLVRVRALASSLEREDTAVLVDIVPAYTTVTVFYDVVALGPGEAPPFERVCELIAKHAAKTEHCWPDVVQTKLGRISPDAGEPRVIEIPVCYGGEFGPDLDEVARHCGLAAREVVALHRGAEYVVHAVGFAPGFPYLGGLPAKLRTPRRPTPRAKVAAGSVGIGWAQTGIYPLETPGGWQLIGRTPLRLFRANDREPALLRMGDRVKFREIRPEEFATWK